MGVVPGDLKDSFTQSAGSPAHRRSGRFSKKATIRVDLNDKRTPDCRKDTANRILGTLKIALNFVCQGDSSIIKVWTAVKPFENVGQPRVDYLEIPDQRRLLSEAGIEKGLRPIEAALSLCIGGNAARRGSQIPIRDRLSMRSWTPR
jgi:hypothetical protein